ncbi:MAG: hypothetical protein ACP5IJ_01540 [Candidatus Nanoarchaeia archaeon]
MATKKFAKVFLVLALFSVLVLASGCVGKPKEKVVANKTAEAFIGGTEGLKISFLPDQPPSEVFAKQSFTIGLKIENIGEGKMFPLNNLNISTLRSGKSDKIGTDKPGAFVEIMGITKEAFTNLKQLTNITEALNPAKKVGKDIVPGGSTFITLTPTAPEIVGASQNYPLVAKLVYAYETKAISTVCLKENIYTQATGGKEICKISGQKPVSNSGGPIQITSVEETYNGFNIKVKNVGTGEPFILNETFKYFNISEIDKFQELNRIWVDNVSLGTKDITSNCTGFVTERVLFLPKGEATFYCTTKVTGGVEAVDQLKITLKYGYITEARTEFTVTSYGVEE